MKRLIFLLTVLPGLAAAPAALANQEGQSYGPPMWDGGWLGWFYGPLTMILVVAILIVAIVLLTRWIGTPGLGAQHHHQPPAKTPLDILKERFARGEIDKDDFEERRRILAT